MKRKRDLSLNPPQFYFLNPSFSQPTLKKQTPVSAAIGKRVGGNQCTQLMFSNPAKQFAMKTTEAMLKYVILIDGDASPNLKILIIDVLELLLMKLLSKVY